MWIYFVLPHWTPVDKLACFCAAVQVSYIRLQRKYNHRRKKLRPSNINADWNNNRSVKLSGGGSVTLYKLDQKQAHSKAPVK